MFLQVTSMFMKIITKHDKIRYRITQKEKISTLSKVVIVTKHCYSIVNIILFGLNLIYFTCIQTILLPFLECNNKLLQHFFLENDFFQYKGFSVCL